MATAWRQETYPFGYLSLDMPRNKPPRSWKKTAGLLPTPSHGSLPQYLQRAIFPPNFGLEANDRCCDCLRVEEQPES